MAATTPHSTTSRRRILVSGGTSGIGRAVSEHLSLKGDEVWIIGSNEDRLQRTLDHLPLKGGTLCDVANDDQVATAVSAIANELGGLDGAFINAGIDGQGVSFTELNLQAMRRVLDVNLLGAISVAQRAIGVLTRPSTIVFNASTNAVRPEARFLDYNASKAALVSAVQTMAIEMSHTGLSFIALCPGYFPTPMTNEYLDNPEVSSSLLNQIPARRFGSLDELAAIVDFLLSGSAAFMTGSVLTVDGGSHI